MTRLYLLLICGSQRAWSLMMPTVQCPPRPAPGVPPNHPGRRAATVSPIEDDGWCAVSAMVEKKRSAVVMDELVAAGAEDVFLVALHNCRV
jgi:ATP phosphoribosyltransferase-like protein